MPHDPLFEERIADALSARGAKAEPKKMFGGVAFMVHGNMSVGITNKGDLMVRFDAERHEEVLRWPGAKPMTYGHGKMKGFLFVDADAVATRSALDKWIDLALIYVAGLPAKRTRTAAKKATSKKKVVGKKRSRF